MLLMMMKEVKRGYKLEMPMVSLLEYMMEIGMDW